MIPQHFVRHLRQQKHAFALLLLSLGVLNAPSRVLRTLQTHFIARLFPVIQFRKHRKTRFALEITYLKVIIVVVTLCLFKEFVCVFCVVLKSGLLQSLLIDHFEDLELNCKRLLRECLNQNCCLRHQTLRDFNLLHFKESRAYLIVIFCFILNELLRIHQTFFFRNIVKVNFTR